MNAYYHKSEKDHSNNDIFMTYLLGEAKTAPAWKRHADGILALLMALVSILTSAVARRIFRVLCVATLLVALVGVIGAVESGVLGLGWGFLLGLSILALEYLALRRS